MNTPTQDTLFIAVRAFATSLLPGIEVVQVQGNAVPMPAGQFVALSPASLRRLSTNVSSFDPVGNTRDVMMPTEYSIQMDCYGPDASDFATTLVAMFRDEYGCNMLAPYGCQPLFTSDPTQAPLVTGEESYEQRWMITAVLQFNPVISVTQEYADALAVDLVNVDANFPP